MERSVQYLRHEFRYEPELRRAPLTAFIFDIPYMGACGIFPPMHLLNWKLSTGGGDGGMSPGASWTPFQLGEREYAQLLRNVLDPDIALIKELSRYSWQRWAVDPEFDHHTDYFEWMAEVCEKHRAAFHVAISKLNQSQNRNE